MEIFLALLAQPVLIAFWAHRRRRVSFAATFLVLVTANVAIASMLGALDGIEAAGEGAGTGGLIAFIRATDTGQVLATLLTTGVIGILAVTAFKRRAV